MKIVLDTNILLVSIFSRSKFRPVFDAFLAEDFHLDAKFLVSEDKHFNILKEINFPKVELIDTKTFLQILSSDK